MSRWTVVVIGFRTSLANMENVSMQANRRMRQQHPSACSVAVSKSGSERSLDGFLAEAAAREIPGGPGPAAPPLDQRGGPGWLGLQLRQRRRDERLVEPLGQQPVPDRRVAVAALGERARP